MAALETLKSEALTLAGKAATFAVHLRSGAAGDVRPDPADYAELAAMIRRLAEALPGASTASEKIEAGTYDADVADDGTIGVFDGNAFLFSLSAGFPVSHVKDACDAFNQGRSFAEQQERARQQAEFTRTLDAYLAARQTA